jgi:hypothetical protein
MYPSGHQRRNDYSILPILKKTQYIAGYGGSNILNLVQEIQRRFHQWFKVTKALC